jgi:hypothetical protein
MKTKLPKLRPAEHVALLQFRENLEGGDPHMGMVDGKTARSLEAKGLISVAYYDGLDSQGFHRRVFQRADIPTRLGLAVLDAMTYGPRP